MIVNGEKTKIVDKARYLGIYLDRQLRGSEHIQAVVVKASKMPASIARILSNIHGPKEARQRRIIMSASESISLYGVSVRTSHGLRL